MWFKTVIARRLIFWLILFSLILASGRTFYVLWNDYQAQLAAIEARNDQIAKSLVPSIVNSLWNMDTALLDIQLRGIGAIAHVCYVELKEKRAGAGLSTPELQQSLFRREIGGLPPLAAQIKYVHPLIRKSAWRRFELGRLTVIFSRQGIWQQLRHRALTALFSQALQIFSMSLLIFLLFYVMVTRRLIRIHGYMKRLDSKNLKTPLILKTVGRDELSQLVDSINEMREKLRRDIEQRKAAEEALARQERQYRSVFNSVRDGLIIFDRQGRIRAVNPRACEMYGYTDLELKGMAGKKLVHPDFQYLMDAFLEQTAVQGEFAAESVDMRKDGQTFATDVRGTPVEYQGTPHLLAVVRDISQRKQAEQARKQLEAQFYEAQKMEAVGTLAGGIAHDVNNLLMGIQGHASLMLMKTPPADRFYEPLKRIEGSVQRGAELTRQLLGYARGGTYEVRPLDLNQLIRDQSQMFGRTKKEIRLEEKLAPDIWTVEADCGQVEQVVLNLFINAWQAMPDGGTLRVSTENVCVAGSMARAHGVRPGDYVRITVSDTGVGMDPEVLARIFEPFFTTKSPGQGTGLGLASAYGIVKNHGGFIRVESEKGKGSRFFVQIPRSEKKIEAKAACPASDAPISGTETILLVDDEPMVLEVGSQMAESLGYRCLTAGSGQEALRVYREHADQIAAVILDMIMPEMSGTQTYQALKAMAPRIRVILSSGYSMNADARRLFDQGCNGFIQKPFNILALSKKLREVLDREAAGNQS